MPKTFSHPVEYLGFGQENFSQCWFASYQMLVKYLGRNVNEVNDKLSPVINLPDAKSKGMLIADYTKAATALGLTVYDTAVFRKKQDFFDIGLSDGAEAFLEKLQKNPLWVSRYSSPNVYHVTIAVGYDDSESNIIFHNPFPGKEHAKIDRLKANVYVRHITRQPGSVQAPTPPST